jgi:predicted thioesterase
MKNKPPIGTSHELQFVVAASHLIDFATDGMPGVLSTPQLLGWLERTARELLVPFLEPGESSVGMEVEIAHLAPTPPGQTVTCVARVVQAEGARVTFTIEARDAQERIARGLHKRAVIRKDRFAQAVRRKAGAR